MTSEINCKKLGKLLPALSFAPLPGPIGQQILNDISAQAWDQWLAHQTMLINEYRLNLTDQASREFLRTEMMKFLFQGGSDKPEGYIPEN